MTLLTSISPSIADITSLLRDPKRLDTLNQLDLLDSPADAAFDRLTQLASKIIGTPVALVSLVDSDRQFFKSFFGLPEPWASQRETPLSHSFCQYVVATNQPLVITDARRDPVLKDNLAIRDLDVIGYLGIPLTLTNGIGLGSFCVIDSKPHVWTDHEIEIVRELAQSVMTEIELRVAIKAQESAQATLIQQNQKLRRLTEFCRLTIETMVETVQRSADKAEQLEYLKQAQTQLNHQI